MPKFLDQGHLDSAELHAQQMKYPQNPLKMSVSCIAAATAILIMPMLNIQVTAGYDYFVDAGQDTDADLEWKDLTAGNPSGFGLLIDDSPAVNRVAQAP